MALQPRPILEMRNIVKEFPGVRALDNVTMKVRTGTFTPFVERTAPGNPPS